MKSIILIATFFCATNSAIAYQPYEVTEQECKKWVEANLGTFGICADHTRSSNNAKTYGYAFNVESCRKTNDLFICKASQGFPSSDCEQEIFMDGDCNFNTGSIITKDGREDI